MGRRRQPPDSRWRVWEKVGREAEVQRREPWKSPRDGESGGKVRRQDDVQPGNERSDGMQLGSKKPSIKRLFSLDQYLEYYSPSSYSEHYTLHYLISKQYA